MEVHENKSGVHETGELTTSLEYMRQEDGNKSGVHETGGSATSRECMRQEDWQPLGSA